MATGIRFINITGDCSNASQRAQKRIVSSHVATQRERLKRLRNVAARRSQKTACVLPHKQVIAPTAPLSGHDAKGSIESQDAVLLPVVPFETDSEHTGDENTSPAGISCHTTPDPSPPIANRRRDHSTPASPQSDGYDYVHQLAHKGHPLLHLSETPSPDQYLGQGGRDWFVSMPPITSPRMPKHLFYYVSVLMPKLHPAYTTNLVRLTYGCGMLRDANEIVLASITAFSATSRALLSGDLEGTQNVTASNAFHEDAFDRLYFKGQTIRLINERLNSSRGVDLNDASLFAGISSLIFVEALTGNVNEAVAHMNGLHQLASLWRAKSHSPMPYKLDSKIVAAAIKVSILTNTPPSFPFTLKFDTPIPQPLPGISHLLPELGTRLLKQWPAISLDDTFVSIIHDLNTMTRYTEAVGDRVFPYIEDNSHLEYINYLIMEVEHRLLSYRTMGVVDAACRTTCLLYLNTVLVRGWSNNAAVIRSLVEQLRDVLNIDSNEWSGLEDVLLWVAFIGASCSHRPADAMFFTVLFEKQTLMLGLDSCEQVLKMLSRYMFVGRVHGVSLHRLWGTVKH